MVYQGNNYTTHFYVLKLFFFQVESPESAEEPRPIDEIINSKKDQYSDDYFESPQIYYYDLYCDVKGTYKFCYENNANENIYVLLSLSENGNNDRYDEEYYYRRHEMEKEDIYEEDDVNIKQGDLSHLDIYNLENTQYSVEYLESDINEMVNDINEYWKINLDHSKSFTKRKSEIKKLTIITLIIYTIAGLIQVVIIKKWLSKYKLPIN